jgi:hypothetical protein
MVEAKKNVLKYFFITKKLVIKMQNGTKEKELRQELEDFKSEGIAIINPEKRTPRDLKRFRETRNMPNYRNSYEEIYKKLSDLCQQCYENWYTNQAVFRKQYPRKYKDEYMPIRFAEPRMITLPKWFEIKETKDLREGKMEKERRQLEQREK